ncbi:hypothetical protein DPMN_112442 [Dreissena polymorpha]|uniref:Uncharacterized protein n=1 Tax=Dreissena polymorpha TaxID=45954 RepID=A0A9D4KH25_DREPO|nr:hypothetical protein DPMN_112442 [Dreissena polymorpha]
MDERLLGKAVEYHGPDFLRQLQLEQEKVPANIFLHLQNHRPQVPEIKYDQYVRNNRREHFRD